MFDILRDILHRKTGEYIDNTESMNEYSLYMIQRWISMYSNHPIDFLNSTVNILYNVMNDTESYKFLLTSLPKYKYKKIEYIKSTEKKKYKKDKEVDLFFVEDNRNKLDESVRFVFRGEDDQKI